MAGRKIKNNFLKTTLFFCIGAAAIVLTDLLILGGAQQVSRHHSAAETITVSGLKAQHALYMDEGIEIPPDLFVARNVAVSIDSPSVSKSQDAQDAQAAQIVTIEEILLQEKNATFASIEPALGITKEVQDLKVGFSKPNERSLTEVIKTTLESEQALYDTPKGTGLIAIIIDDMGISLRSKQVEVLPAPLTLSYLPYAENLPQRTKRAAQNGHELMLHMPMEPLNGKLDGGPKVLNLAQNEAEFIETLQWGLSSFDGFVGLNNHMGSRLTKDRAAMQRVMNHIKGQGLYFVDSKTISTSVAASVARDMGVPYAARDVFLDHEVSADFVQKSLKKLEQVARRKGYAIAIGHPHKETIAALKEWLPTLQDKGLTLVPVSRLIKYPTAAEEDLTVSSER